MVGDFHSLWDVSLGGEVCVFGWLDLNSLQCLVITSPLLIGFSLEKWFRFPYFLVSWVILGNVLSILNLLRSGSCTHPLEKAEGFVVSVVD